MDAATELFYRKGFPATSIDEIGEAAGITGPGIYRHFESKDEILLAVFDRIWGLIRPALEAAERQPGRALELLLDAHLDLAIEHRPELLVLVRELRHVSPEYRKATERNDSRYMDAWASAISVVRPRLGLERTRAAARAVTGLISSAAGEPRARRLASDEYRVLLTSMAYAALSGIPEN